MKPSRKHTLALLVILAALVSGACNLAQRVVDSVPLPGPSNPGDGTPQTLAPTLTPGSTPRAPGPVEVQRPPDEIVADQAAALLPGQTGNLAELPDASRYWIDVQIDFYGQAYQGTQRIDYTNIEADTLDSLFLRLLPNGEAAYGRGSLEVTNLQVDGQAVEGLLSLQDSVLEMPLPEPLAPGEKALIELEFSGRVPFEFSGGGYGIFNFSDDVLTLSGWYPMLAVYDEAGWNLQPVSNIGDSVYADIAFYEVQVNTSTEVMVAATGIDANGQDGQPATSFAFISGPVREFTLAAMGGEYEVLRAEVGGILVSSYYQDGSEQGAQAALEIAVDSLRIYNEKIGPYPYTQLDILQTPMRYAAGVEFPGVLMIAADMYTQSDRGFFRETVAHEVAHMWWYNTVGNNVFEEPWLDEALTTYTSVLYFEFQRGQRAKDSLIGEWERIYSAYTSRGQDDPVARPLEYFEQQPENMYAIVVYIKGALFFHTLRQEIGDQAFFSALQAYYHDHAYGIARGEDLLEAFETAAGRQLDEIYNQWLFSNP